MTSRKREIAKFFCGAEAFHALVHMYFWFSGMTLTVFGIIVPPTVIALGAVVNTAISVFLGVYAWNRKTQE